MSEAPLTTLEHLVDRNGSQLDELEQSIDAIRKEREALVRESVVLQARCTSCKESSQKAGHAKLSQIARLNFINEENARLKESNDAALASANALQRQIESVEDVVEKQRHDFMKRHDAIRREIASIWSDGLDAIQKPAEALAGLRAIDVEGDAFAAIVGSYEAVLKRGVKDIDELMEGSSGDAPMQEAADA